MSEHTDIDGGESLGNQIAGYFCERGHVSLLPDGADDADVVGRTLPCAVCGASVHVGSGDDDETANQGEVA